MRWTALLAASLVVPACGPRPAPTTSTDPPERLVFAGPAETLHLAGAVSGSLPGLGPEVRVEAWLRGDGRARVTMRGKGDDGRPTHEVLLWGPDHCLLFDSTTGRFADLGEGRGVLHALENAFELRDAVFLACGRDPVWPGAAPTELAGAARDFRGVRGAGTLRREGDRAGLRWRAEDGTIHDISVSYDDYLETARGPWPASVEVSGTELAAAARLRWEEVGEIVVLGDSIFDPLWEPAGP